MRWYVALALALTIACKPSSEEEDDIELRHCAEVLFDSLGEPYPTGERSFCFPGVGEDTPTGDQGSGQCTDDGIPGVSFVDGRFFEACPSCNTESAGVFTSTDCRPLVCETDDDCPVFFTGSSEEDIVVHTYECRNSLCQDQDTELHPLDVITPGNAMLLCLADVARGDQYEGEPVCPGVESDDEPCPLPLPDACMQP